MDELNGPLAISLKREKLVEDLAEFFDISTTMGGGSQAPPPKHQYRVIVRTSEVRREGRKGRDVPALVGGGLLQPPLLPI